LHKIIARKILDKLFKGDPKMKRNGSLALLTILFAGLVGCTSAPDRIIYKEYAGYNYCHMKIETSSNPANPTQREVIDFYGACDEHPSDITAYRFARDYRE
jgi:hypothetical protein